MVVKTKKNHRRKTQDASRKSQVASRKSQVASRKHKTLKGGSVRSPNKFQRSPTGNHIKPVEPESQKSPTGNHRKHGEPKLQQFPTGKDIHIQPVAPKLKRRFFGYRPLKATNISAPLKLISPSPRKLSLTNGKLLTESTSHFEVQKSKYNPMSHYLGGNAEEVETINEEL